MIFNKLISQKKKEIEVMISKRIKIYKKEEDKPQTEETYRRWALNECREYNWIRDLEVELALLETLGKKVEDEIDKIKFCDRIGAEGYENENDLELDIRLHKELKSSLAEITLEEK